MNTGYDQGGHWRTLTGVLALHGLAVLALWSMKPPAEAVRLPQPLMVSLLTDASPELPSKPVPPPPPRAVQPAALPALAVQEEALAPVPPPIHTLAPVRPEPVVAAAAPAPAAPIAPPTVVPPSVIPPPVVPPRFDADYLDNPAPAYPALSRRMGEHGRVLLRVYVGPDGQAAQVEVRESSGFERLDKAARETVQRWRFVPARQGDKGVAAWVQVPISFSIRS